MDSLFDKKYEIKQPLRKYEPLIRFDVDGNPQPRKPLSQTASERVAQPAPETAKAKVAEPVKHVTPAVKLHDDLKRKVDGPASGMEPKKKQQKQTSITAFFKKN